MALPRMPWRSVGVLKLTLPLLIIGSEVHAERIVRPIDPKRTHIQFAVDAVGWPRTEGAFRNFNGRLAVDFDNPARSSVSFEVSAASVATGSNALDDLLRSSAFLNAQHHPFLSFTSTNVVRTGNRTVQVQGEMTLLGVKRPVALIVNVDRPQGGRASLGFRATGTLRRTDFGMTTGLPLISNDVAVTVTTELPAQ